MFKKFFKKRKEPESKLISISELDKELEDLIKAKEDSFLDYVSKKIPEVKNLVSNLIVEVENFEPSELHPRLRGVGSSFKSSFIELWKNLDAEKFENVEKAVEKTALMKIKHFRLLFGVNPPELEPVNQSLANIANVVNELKERREESGINRLESIKERIAEIEDLIESKNRLNNRIENLTAEMDRMSEKKEDLPEKDILSELEAKMKKLEHEIHKKERDVQEKVALARKPLKIYSHMIGGKKMDFNFEDDDVARIASNAASEILKGNIKLKEKQVNKVLNSLKSISSGEVKKEYEEIKKLRNKLFMIKDEITGIKVKMGRKKPDEIRIKGIEKEFKSCNEKIKSIERKIQVEKKNLENELTDVFGYRIVLKI